VDKDDLLHIYKIDYDPKKKEFIILMEYGIRTLKDLFEHSSCSYENFFKDLEEQLLSQLETLKSILFYHRDIKPKNIIITSDFKFKFADYGLAKKLKYLGEQQISVGGTPYYWHSEIDKAYREKKSFCMIDPFEADHYSIKQVLKEASEWHQQKSHTTMEQVKKEFIC